MVRKAFGYSHIPQRFAAPINAFCREHLNPYVNLHRPCLFAKEVVDAKGKVRKTYPHNMVQTPLDKLASLEVAGKFLRNGVTIEQLQLQAKTQSSRRATSAVALAIRRPTGCEVGQVLPDRMWQWSPEVRAAPVTTT